MYSHCMPVFSKSERRFLSAVADLVNCNPFLPERLASEQAALGPEFVPSGPVWSVTVSDPEAQRPNVPLIQAKLSKIIEGLQPRLKSAPDLQAEELGIYEECVLYLLYQRCHSRFSESGKWNFYRDFLSDWNRLCHFPGKQSASNLEPAHVFACLRQVQRAFHHIYESIVGNSMPAARLRASVWQSIFTHDMRRYRRALYRKM